MKPPHSATHPPAKGNPFAALRKGKHAKGKPKSKMAPPMTMPPASAPVAPVLPSLGKRVSVAPQLDATPPTPKNPDDETL